MLLWEIIGVSSFLLIGFWLTRAQAVKSAIKALTINRVGDIALTIGFIVVLAIFGSVNYSTIFALSSYGQETLLVVATILILIGGIAKSAQVPFAGWLADAIERTNSCK